MTVYAVKSSKSTFRPEAYIHIVSIRIFNVKQINAFFNIADASQALRIYHAYYGMLLDVERFDIFDLIITAVALDYYFVL